MKIVFLYFNYKLLMPIVNGTWIESEVELIHKRGERIRE
jgi:hypothetical protein